MTRPMVPVRVTKSDIMLGKREDCGRCALAIALRRTGYELGDGVGQDHDTAHVFLADCSIAGAKHAETVIRDAGEWVAGDTLISAVTRLVAAAKDRDAGSERLKEHVRYGDQQHTRAESALRRVAELEAALRKYGNRDWHYSCSSVTRTDLPCDCGTANHNNAVERILDGSAKKETTCAT